MAAPTPGSARASRASRRRPSRVPPYTEGTLMKDMASIAKYVRDPEIARILKEKDAGKKGEHGGIGRSTTRARPIYAAPT